MLITGGVHGYEMSGVQGAILFLQTKALEYASKYNIVVAPCVSPWGCVNLHTTLPERAPYGKRAVDCTPPPFPHCYRCPPLQS